MGKISGIPIALDYSWFIIFLLIAWSVGFGMAPTEYPGLGAVEYFVIGLLASVLLFVSIVVHELAHSIVAKRNGLKIRQITLFIFGGVSQMEEEPRTASLELRMSLAGPLTSVVLAVVLYFAWLASVYTRANPLVGVPLNYAALVNGIVAAFNLIPAFPLDGGRVLRSLLWRRNGDLLRSTATSVKAAKFVAYTMMLIGGVFMFTVDVVSGLWFILIGWFVVSGAQGEMAQMMLQQELSNLRAADIMTRKVDSVPPDMTLDRLQEEFFRLKHNGFPVLSGSELQGCVTVDDLKKAKRDRWPATKVSDVMTPRENLAVMAEDDPSTKALQLMGSRAIGRVFVIGKDGRISGIVTRSDVIRAAQLQQLAATPGGGLMGGSFTVERGMGFILEQPAFEGTRWKAVYDATQVELVSERGAKHTDGREYSQFVFEASKPGILSISLVLEDTATTGAARRPTRTVSYRVTVMDNPQSGSAASQGS
jgi:Zn-dependent protease/CBS domain-containing protein